MFADFLFWPNENDDHHGFVKGSDECFQLLTISHQVVLFEVFTSLNLLCQTLHVAHKNYIVHVLEDDADPLVIEINIWYPHIFGVDVDLLHVFVIRWIPRQEWVEPGLENDWLNVMR